MALTIGPIVVGVLIGRTEQTDRGIGVGEMNANIDEATVGITETDGHAHLGCHIENFNVGRLHRHPHLIVLSAPVIQIALHAIHKELDGTVHVTDLIGCEGGGEDGDIDLYSGGVTLVLNGHTAGHRPGIIGRETIGKERIPTLNLSLRVRGFHQDEFTLGLTIMGQSIKGVTIFVKEKSLL